MPAASVVLLRERRGRDGGKHQPTLRVVSVLAIVNFKANRSPVYSPRYKLPTSPAISAAALS